MSPCTRAFGFDLRDVFRFWKRDLQRRLLLSRTCRPRASWCRSSSFLLRNFRQQTAPPPALPCRWARKVAALGRARVPQSWWGPAFAAQALAQLASRLVLADSAGAQQRLALVRNRLRSAWRRRPCTARHRPFRSHHGLACPPCRLAIRRCTPWEFSRKTRCWLTVTALLAAEASQRSASAEEPKPQVSHQPCIVRRATPPCNL